MFIVLCLIFELRRSSRFFDVATLLISNIDISSSTSVPEDVFIMIDDILQNLYPPQTNDLHDSLQFFTALKAVIIACPPSLLLPVLVTIQNGLCIWILDKDEAVSNASFNDVVRFLPQFCAEHPVAHSRYSDNPYLY